MISLRASCDRNNLNSKTTWKIQSLIQSFSTREEIQSTGKRFNLHAKRFNLHAKTSLLNLSRNIDPTKTVNIYVEIISYLNQTSFLSYCSKTNQNSISRPHSLYQSGTTESLWRLNQCLLTHTIRILPTRDQSRMVKRHLAIRIHGNSWSCSHWSHLLHNCRQLQCQSSINLKETGNTGIKGLVSDYLDQSTASFNIVPNSLWQKSHQVPLQGAVKELFDGAWHRIWFNNLRHLNDTRSIHAGKREAIEINQLQPLNPCTSAKFPFLISRKLYVRIPRASQCHYREMLHLLRYFNILQDNL